MPIFSTLELTSLDSYGQRFATPGLVHYSIGSRIAAMLAFDDHHLVIDVKDQPDAEQQQHDIAVKHTDGEFNVSPRRLTINAGDIVVWHASRPDTPPFTVWGTTSSGGFSSAVLTAETFFSHVCDRPGEIEWTDGSDRGLHGKVRVAQYDDTAPGGIDRWRQLVGEGVVMLVEGGRVEPRAVDLVVGQALVIAVTDSAGVTITGLAATAAEMPA
jgi:plastocyanin